MRAYRMFGVSLASYAVALLGAVASAARFFTTFGPSCG
jgi:hypothetical protein